MKHKDSVALARKRCRAEKLVWLKCSLVGLHIADGTLHEAKPRRDTNEGVRLLFMQHLLKLMPDLHARVEVERGTHLIDERIRTRGIPLHEVVAALFDGLGVEDRFLATSQPTPS